MSLTEYSMGGAATVLSTGPDDATPSFAVLHTGSITPSLTNPRKTFDEAKLRELAASIKASGVHQPVLVRPLPAGRLQDTFTDRRPGMPLPSYELVAGERRLRACRAAGVDHIPAMIKTLTDNEVLECQIVENLQRDDLAPLEEAEGYQTLIDATGIAKESIGERIGRSRTYVYGRLKLLELCQKARAAMREGKIDHSTGLLIARIPDEKLQLKALKEFTATDYSGDARMGHRAKLAWIHQNVMLKLKDARFDIKDASLMPAAGSCETCSKRTGANPDLFSDIDAPDLCTDPPCFHGKEAARAAAIVEQARHKGIEVIEGKEALELKPTSWRAIAGFTPIDDGRVHDPAKGESVSLREALTRAELKKEVRLFIDPHTGEPQEVVPDALADAVRVRMNPRSNEEAAEDRKGDEEADRERLRREYENRWREAGKQAIQNGIDAGKVQRFELPLMRAILHKMATHEDIDTEDVGTLLQIPPEADFFEAIEAAIAATPDDQVGPRICTLLAQFEAGATLGYQLNAGTPVIESLASTCGVDLKAIQSKVQQDMKAERAADKTAKRKKAGEQ